MNSKVLHPDYPSHQQKSSTFFLENGNKNMSEK
jgi:hypothetical protein